MDFLRSESNLVDEVRLTMTEHSLAERLIRIEERLALITDQQNKFSIEIRLQLQQLFTKLETDFVTKHELGLREQIRRETGSAQAVNVSKVIILLSVGFSIVWAVLKHA